MKVHGCLVGAGCIVAMALIDTALPAQDPAPHGVVSIFNGKDLTARKVPDGDNGHGKVVGGVLDYDLPLAIGTGVGAASDADRATSPSETIRLFNGKDLTNFYTWLADSQYEDPDRVFSVVDDIDGAPAIRISGEHWGGIVTKQAYRDYHLIFEYRWGLTTWGERQDRARDSGILLHSQGPDGNYAEDFNGPWMRSVEFQIIEGGVGDIILVRGYTEDGKRVAPRVTATVRSEQRWDSNGAPREFEGGRIYWYGRDPAWKDVRGFRGREDVEHLVGQWNRLEAFADNDSLVYMVNGVIVNKATRSSLTEGRLLIESEGAEIYIRRIELRPLPEHPRTRQ